MSPVASSELQRVAIALFYLISAARWLLCAQHVRGSRRRKLSQVPRASGERGEITTRACATGETGTKVERYEPFMHGYYHSRSIHYIHYVSESATLFSSITLTFLDRFLYFCAIGNRNEYSKVA